MKSRGDPEVQATSFRHTRRDDDDDRDQPFLIERRVAVTAADGSVVVHKFWTDTHTA